MKRFLLTGFVFLLSAMLGFGSDWIKITGDRSPAEINLLGSDITKSTIRIQIPGYQLLPVETPRGQQYVVDLPEATTMLKKGAPDLPKLTASLMIPDMAGMEVRIVSSDYTEYHDIEIAPSKGTFTRDIDPSTVPYIYGEVYEEDAWFPGKLASLRDPYIIRDYRGQTVMVYPFRYNPVQKILKVYHSITLEVYKANDSGVNPLARKENPDKIQEDFRKIYDRHFLNAQAMRYDPVDEAGSMLIISHGDFMEAMQPFLEWKIMSGMPTEMIDVAEIGNNSNLIKTYITDYYNNHDLAYVLLVGDGAQVRPSFNNGDSDNDYAYLVGDDHYPDVFIGRFSAENIAHVETQVARTLEYEKNPYTEVDWFTSNIGISSSQGPGDDNEMDYEHIRNIQDDLINFTYTASSELFDGSQGGLDEPGSPTPAMVGEEIDAGASVINYTGHGSTSSWGSSGYSSSHISSLSNQGMYPFIWSVACVNGNFNGSTCFAEAWLRAEDNGNPTGAIATMMSTINQSWNPPMCGQDEMNDILVESYENNIKRTFGGISMNGCMQMNDEYGNDGDRMTDTWVCFGDPSLMVRTAMPTEITTTYNTTIFIGATQLVVNADAEGSRVALSKDNELIATAYIEDGTATLNFEAMSEVAVYDLVITGFNYLPHFGELEVIPADGPYVVYADNLLNDEAGNNNGLADYGETIRLSLELENVGIEDAENVMVQLGTSDEYVTLTDAEEEYILIPAGERLSVENGFEIELSSDIPDEHTLRFEITAGSGDDVWTSSFSIKAHAPMLSFLEYVMDDSLGNNNGLFDPGETVSLNISIENAGSAEAYDIIGMLNSGYEFVTVEEGELPFGSIEPASTVEQTFTVSAAEFIPGGFTNPFEFSFYSSGEFVGETGFELVIGQPQILVLEFDHSPSTGTAIREILQEKGIAIQTAQTLAAVTPGDYLAIFTCLGVYDENHTLSAQEGNILADYLDAGGNLYMEGGDTWAYDDPTEVHGMFGINGLDDGSNDLAQLRGIEGTFTEGFLYDYNGENNWIDHLEAVDGSFAILENAVPSYVAAVANDAGAYKTIGSSFEFGGLTDGENATEELLWKYLEFFGLGIPEKPEMPVGETSICSGTTGTAYEITPVNGAEHYMWQLEPATAGSIEVSDHQITIDWNVDFHGTAVLQVCGMNSLGMGPMSDSCEIEVMASPGISLGADTSICINHNLELTPGDGYTTYAWMDGSAESTLLVDSTFGGLGIVDVSVMVTDDNGCTAVDTLKLEFTECAGVGEMPLQEMLSIYPNPSSGIVQLELENSQEQIRKISVINSIGKVIYDIETPFGDKHNLKLDFTGHGNGIYFILVETANKRFTKKIVVEQ